MISTADQVKNGPHLQRVSEKWPASTVEQITIGVPEGNAMVSYSKEEGKNDYKVRIMVDGTQYQQD